MLFRSSIVAGTALVPDRPYSGATIWPALRGAKAKFKGSGAGALADEGRRLLRALHIYVFENK
jgi:hypothetical protein